MTDDLDDLVDRLDDLDRRIERLELRAQYGPLASAVRAYRSLRS
jgi:hypothetical protein